MKRVFLRHFFLILCLLGSLSLTSLAQQQSINELKNKINKAQERGDMRQVAKLKMFLGNQYLKVGQRGNATQAFEAALSHPEAERVTKGYAYWGLARNRKNTSRNFERSMKEFRLGQFWELYYRVLDDAGKYYMAKKDYGKAQEYYETMRSGAKSFAFTDYVERADIQLEKIYRATDQRARASQVRRERSGAGVIRNSEVSDLRTREQELDSVRLALDSLMAVTTEDSARKEQLAVAKEKAEAELQEVSTQKELALKKAEAEEIQRKAAENRSRIILIGAVSVIGLLIVIAIIIFANARKVKRKNKQISEQKQLIEQERNKSEELLLNILPQPVADELKENGKAEPKYYEQATVIFTDFKGFTQIAEKMTPQELIRELEEYFLEFDEILERHNLEKIKTIGDAYMCAGGLPVPNTSNPVDAVKAGIDMQKFMARKREEKEREGKPCFRLRVGVHSGAVIAGVVGRKKFAYDIWGDTVNIAARMEQSGEPDKVNISGETYELVKDKFNCKYRGKVQAKNKGEIDMYFVEGIAWNAYKSGGF